MEQSSNIWEQLPLPLLSHSLQWIPIFELATSVSDVSHSWREAVNYPLTCRSRDNERLVNQKYNWESLSPCISYFERMSDLARAAPYGKMITLRNATLNDVQLTRLFGSMKQVSNLVLQGVNGFTSSCANSIPPTVTSLTWDAPASDETLISIAARCTGLKAFSFSGDCHLEVEKQQPIISGLKVISALPSLTSLHLIRTKATDDVMEVIASSHSLNSLTILFCEQLTDEGMRQLFRLRILRSLYVNVGPEGSAIKFQPLFAPLASTEGSMADLVLSEDGDDMLCDEQLNAFFGRENQFTSRNGLEVLRVGGFSELSIGGFVRLFEQALLMPRLRAMRIPFWTQPPALVDPLKQLLAAEGYIDLEIDPNTGQPKPLKIIKESYWRAGEAMPVSHEFLHKMLKVTKEVADASK